PGALELELRVPAGSVEIEASETSTTEVTLEPVGGEASEEAVASARVELRERPDGGHVVFVDVPDRRTFGISLSFGRGPEVRLRVRCPRGADADVRTRSADVEARGRYASLEARTVSGDVRWSEVDGDARLETVSGDVRIDRIGGRADAQSVSGDLTLVEVGGEFRSKTVSGDQAIESAASGKASVESVSGDIRVGIRRGSRLFVDAHALSGDLSSELDLEGGADSGDGPLVELRAKTVSGDIRVVRAG
ncbi:MAG: DUF4097 family beta strand repeat-containing protein, partial [Gaiellaceae bacterium]